MKPFSESCEQNKKPILDVIRPIFNDCQSVLEVGSGTGQHAVYFAQQLPHLTWYTSDVRASHAGIRQWLEESDIDNVRQPLELDALRSPWPSLLVDAVFSANTTHIMHWPEVDAFIRGVGSLLDTGGRFALYGPFNYQGAFTSDSNARFDQWLKERDPESGIRDFEKLNQLAGESGMDLINDVGMPANNRLLYWQKR